MSFSTLYNQPEISAHLPFLAACSASAQPPFAVGDWLVVARASASIAFLQMVSKIVVSRDKRHPSEIQVFLQKFLCLLQEKALSTICSCFSASSLACSTARSIDLKTLLRLIVPIEVLRQCWEDELSEMEEFD